MSTPSFNDHFSQASALYARYRPTYPDALFAYLAEQAPGHRLAWDCGTGSGQAARGLAPHFDRVLATDGSAEQIAQAPLSSWSATNRYRAAQGRDPLDAVRARLSDAWGLSETRLVEWPLSMRIGRWPGTGDRPGQSRFRTP